MAAMKMTMHSAAGVEKGLRSANGMPVEVMGLLHGHPAADAPDTLVVTDAFPLPIEGTETTVMADNPEVRQHARRAHLRACLRAWPACAHCSTPICAPARALSSRAGHDLHDQPRQHAGGRAWLRATRAPGSTL